MTRYSGDICECPFNDHLNGYNCVYTRSNGYSMVIIGVYPNRRVNVVVVLLLCGVQVHSLLLVMKAANYNITMTFRGLPVLLSDRYRT